MGAVRRPCPLHMLQKSASPSSSARMPRRETEHDPVLARDSASGSPVSHAARNPLNPPCQAATAAEANGVPSTSMRCMITASLRASATFGDIGHPQPIGLIRGEIAVDEIGRLARPIPHGRDGALATAHADQTSVQHQPGNPFATDTNAGFRKINLETRCSIGAFRRGVRRADFRGQRGVHQGTRRGRPLPPRVIAASVTGRRLSIPLLRYPIAGHLLLYGVGARPPPDGVR